uniref:Ig-like domain-containing protein n=1 Tax=Hucho hucho TaxID=62062 RepID=A0A4W5K149_9TELE
NTMMLLTSILLLMLVFFSFPGDTLEDDITLNSPEVYYLEGSRVKISCDYTVIADSLLWYRQYSGSDTFSSGETTTEFKERFDARLNFTAKSVPLTIQRVQLSDSAVYYCALKPTVTTGYTASLQKLLAGMSSNPSVVKCKPEEH